MDCSETVTKVDLTSRPFKIWTEGKEDKAPILANALIISTGATAKRMFLPGEDTYWQNGISACAVCDGACSTHRAHEAGRRAARLADGATCTRYERG